MLHALGASRVALLTNNPDKRAQLARLGITIAKQVPTALHLNETNAAYLTAKARRGGHDLLSQSLDRTAGLEREGEPRRPAGPAHLDAMD
jgi:GTP cyclohydrolase II